MPMDWFSLGLGGGIGFVTGLIAIVYLFLRLNLFQERIFGFIDIYIEDFAARLEKNPQMASKFVKPLIASAMRELGAGGGSEPMIKVPFLGKVPASFITGLLGKGAKEVASEGLNVGKNLLG